MYCQYTDKVEPVALDECYLDVTGKGSATLIAKELKYIEEQEYQHLSEEIISIRKMIIKYQSELN